MGNPFCPTLAVIYACRDNQLRLSRTLLDSNIEAFLKLRQGVNSDDKEITVFKVSKSVARSLYTVYYQNQRSARLIPDWNLPEGAKMRLGKGEISGNIAYSPDGTRLAVASTIR